MCIRDRDRTMEKISRVAGNQMCNSSMTKRTEMLKGIFQICLLYTSDAADERSSVDLGGRRIIKKKNNLIRITRHRL